MKKLGLFFLGIIFCERLFGATLYVDLNSTAPAAPFNSWASASTNIQAAVNAAATGDTILVTNGHYLLNAEILVAKQVTIQSINGPETTIVDGQGSVRCFNLGDSACTLSGLTITNGYNGHGGGIYCDDTTPVVTNCTITGNVALFDGGGMEGGTAYHCIITGNWARSGGGMSGGTAHYCTISGNSAQNQGGGMGGGTAHHCTISGNSGRYGGGMVGGTAYHCIFSGNTAREGGGMKGDTAYHCTFSGNSALQGGGMHSGTANNCTFSGNSATEYGGGMVGYTANNCTFSGNSATEYGGGMVGCTANNCIVWYNTAPSEKDLSYTTARYSCSPDLIHGVDGNMTNAPAFVDAANGDYHLLSSSPCIAAGNAEYATGTDLDGGLWLNPPSMGCYEYYAADAVYVSPDGDDAHDGLSWATAKATIQAGVDAQNTTDGVIYVSSGTYALTNEIVVAKQVTIQSVSGPETTIVDGQGSVRSER